MLYWSGSDGWGGCCYRGGVEGLDGTAGLKLIQCGE